MCRSGCCDESVMCVGLAVMMSVGSNVYDESRSVCL